jgi:hypothetical protein
MIFICIYISYDKEDFMRNTTLLSVLFYIFSINVVGAAFNIVKSLEEKFFADVFPETNEKIDLKTTKYNFLDPNEANPQNMLKHLEDITMNGYFITTGSERAFFLALLAYNKLSGVIVVDIDPKNKAYVDMNILMLRLSDTMEEYQDLSSPLSASEDINDAFIKKQSYIISKLNKSNLPEKAKAYYIRNFAELTKAYFQMSKHSWKTDEWMQEYWFSEVSYYKNYEQFIKLKNLADEGNIIAITTNINDLDLAKKLSDLHISVTDVSNIHEMVPLYLGKFASTRADTRVIWTQPSGLSTAYYSFLQSPVKPEKEDYYEDHIYRLPPQIQPIINVNNHEDIHINFCHDATINLMGEKCREEIEKFCK